MPLAIGWRLTAANIVAIFQSATPEEGQVLSARRIVLMCSLLMGCSPDFSSHYVIHVDPAFSSEYRQAIKDAAWSWTTASNGALTFDLQDDSKWCLGAGESCSHEITMHPTVESLIHELDGTWSAGYTHEKYDCDCGNTVIATDSALIAADTSGTAVRLRALIEHEIGHELALNHTEDGTIMYYTFGKAHGVTCGDVAGAMAIRGMVVQGCE